jgi:hypothetical protein
MPQPRKSRRKIVRGIKRNTGVGKAKHVLPSLLNGTKVREAEIGRKVVWVSF